MDRATPRRRLWIALLTLGIAAAIAPGAARADVDLWPLLELDEDSTTVLYPFYVHEGDFRMVFPFYYRTNHGHDHHLLWPLVKLSDGRLTRVAPIWFSDDEDHFTLFPLVWRRPEYTFFLVPPTYLRRDGSLQALLPFYVRSHGADYDNLWIAWRLFGWKKSAEQSAYFGGYLFHRETGPDRSLTVLMPLFAASRVHEKRAFLFTLFWHSTSPEETDTWLPFPLVRRLSGRDRSQLMVLPFFWERGIHQDSTMLFPLFSVSRKGGVDATPTTRNLHLLWPLYQRKVKTSGDGEVLDRYRRFLIFSDERESTGARKFSILGFVVSERTR